MKSKLKNAFILGLSLCTSIAVAGDIAEKDVSPWLIRVRAIDVMPDVTSSTINLIGGRVAKASNDIVPELDFSYFFTKHIAAEIILATSRHSARATNTALGTVDLGKVSVLPPTLTLQYHFLPEERINPYVGAGINFTHFYDIKNGPVSTSTNYSNTFGPAFQIGADFQIDKHWSLNIDAKKVYIEPDAHVKTGLGRLNTKVKLNPVIIGLGVGYRI